MPFKNPQLRYDTCWPTWKTGKNPTTDREQFTRSNASTARLPTLVRLAETSTQRLTEHKRGTRNGDTSNHIAVHHQLTNNNIDWDSAQCLTYSANYFQRVTLESWYSNLDQTPLNRCQQLPAPYKRLLQNGNETDKRTSNRPAWQYTDPNRPTWLTIYGSKPTNDWWQTLHESFSQYHHG